MAIDAPRSEISRNRPAKRRSALQNVKYLAINAFVTFHIFGISCWCIPTSNSLVQRIKEFERPYFVWSGLFQAWDMFSPSPKSANLYLESVVIYQDGSTQLWSFPRMELLSLRESAFKERYRKYEENLANGENSDLWPDAARHIARLNSGPSNPVQRVMLVARWSAIIPRTDESYGRGPWQVEVFYTYDVKPEDLK